MMTMRTMGLLDLQVNGYAGVDFNSAELTPDALDHALHAMLRAGVTRCLPTLITATESELAARLHALDKAIRDGRLGPIMVPGIHLEGPFLNPAKGYAGCHPAARSGRAAACERAGAEHPGHRRHLSRRRRAGGLRFRRYADRARHRWVGAGAGERSARGIGSAAGSGGAQCGGVGVRRRGTGD